MTTSASCPVCDSEVPPGAPEGMCPRCLIALAGPVVSPFGDGSEPTLHSPLSSQHSSPRGPMTAAAGETLKPGTKVGEYDLLREIGRGGMGVVYEARHTGLKRKVALKVLPWADFASEEQRERFRREAEAAARLNHAHIVSVFEWGNHGGCPFMAMQLVEDARSLVEEIAKGPMPPGDAARVIAKVARAVHYSHQHGVLHRDIKPGNILLDAKGDPLLVDFGLARMDDAAFRLTHPDLVFGTPSYMPPEQAAGEDITTAADVYSLGAVLYEMLTGKPPFRGKSVADTMRQVMEQEPVSPRVIRSELKRDLATIVLKCLEKKPARRYGSAEAFADDLERWVENWPIRARPATITTRAMKWARRRPGVAGLALALVFTSLIGFSSMIIAWRAEEQRQIDYQAQQNELLRQSVERRKEQTELLRQSLISEARALRSGHRDGQQFDAIESLQSAAAIYPSMELRNEAVATLAVSDLRPAQQWEGNPEGQPTAALTQDLKYTAFARANGTVEVCEREGMMVVATLPNEGLPALQDLLFSRDGRWLAAAHTDEGDLRTLVIWDWKNVRPVLRLENVYDQAFAFWPDGSRMVAAIGKEIRVHRLSDGSLERDPIALPAQGISVSVSSSGRRVAVSMDHNPETTLGSEILPEGRMMLLDMQEADVKPVWVDNPVRVDRTSWHPREDWLAVPGLDQTIRIWDAAASPPKVRQTITGPMDVILEAIWSPQGDFIASNSKDGSVKLWDASTGEHYVSVQGSVRTLQFSEDGTRLGLDYRGTSLRLFEVAPLKACRRLQSPPDGSVSDARWNNNGALLAVAANHVRFWNTTGREIGHLPRFDAPRSVIFRKDAVVISGGDGVWRWPLHFEGDNGHLRAVLGEPVSLTRERDQQAAAMSTDEGLLAVARTKDVAIFNLEDPSIPPRVLPGPGGSHIAISPDGTLVATDMALDGSDVLVRHTVTGAVIQRLSVVGSASLGFTVDGHHLITGGRKEFCCWETTTWKPVAKHPCEGLASNASMALSSRPFAAAIGWTQHRTKLVDPTTFTSIVEPDVGSHSPLCFEPSGSLILSSNLMGNLFLWDLAWIRHELARLELDLVFPKLLPSQAPLVEEMEIPSGKLPD